jgi:hypothetical protein
VNVHFEGQKETLWFAPELLEFADQAPEAQPHLVASPKEMKLRIPVPFGTLTLAVGNKFESLFVFEQVADPALCADLFDSFPLRFTLGSWCNAFGKRRAVMIVTDITHQESSRPQAHQELLCQSLAIYRYRVLLSHFEKFATTHNPRPPGGRKKCDETLVSHDELQYCGFEQQIQNPCAIKVLEYEGSELRIPWKMGDRE